MFTVAVRDARLHDHEEPGQVAPPLLPLETLEAVRDFYADASSSFSIAFSSRSPWESRLLGVGRTRVVASGERVFMAYPGFGGVPADPSVSCFEDLVNEVVSRIDRPMALIAQSMGGMLAIEAALRRRVLITHLVLVATSGGLDTSRLGAVDWRQNFTHDHPDLPDWFTSYNSDFTAELSGIDVPVLLIWGDSDPISRVAVGRALLHRFPKAELHIVSGGEHDLARTHARSIAHLIEAHFQTGNRATTESMHRGKE